MLCVALKSYTAPCASTTGGVSDIWVYDPSDFNWTQDESTKKYTAVALRNGSNGKFYPLKFQRKEAIEIAKKFNMSERSVDSFLKDCLGKYLLQPKTGWYEKVK